MKTLSFLYIITIIICRYSFFRNPRIPIFSRWILFLFLLLFTACSDDDTAVPYPEIGDIRSESYNTVISVSNLSQLMATETSTKQGSVLVLLEDGEYRLTRQIYLTGEHICYRSRSGNRDAVVIRGNGMGDSSVPYIFNVAGKRFRVMDLTLGEVYYHGIQVHGESDADFFAADNVRFFNCRQQMLKGSFEKTKPEKTADYGMVNNCLFEYTAGTGFYWYCGGVDVHGGANWQILGSTFRNIISPEENLAEGAVHFWSSASGTVVDSNRIINCGRGILFGLDNSPHFGGRISNNFIQTVRDTGIYLCDARDAQVFHNTIHINSEYSSAVEYRFNTTGTRLWNNLADKPFVSRNGGSADLQGNMNEAQSGWFIDAAAGDLHLTTAAATALPRGVAGTGILTGTRVQLCPESGRMSTDRQLLRATRGSVF